MKRIKQLLSIVVILGVMLCVYTSAKLPDAVNLKMFIKGVIHTEILQQDFVEIEDGILFYKTRNVDALITHLEGNNYQFQEQMGAGYVFAKEENIYVCTSQALTRRHSYMNTRYLGIE